MGWKELTFLVLGLIFLNVLIAFVKISPELLFVGILPAFIFVFAYIALKQNIKRHHEEAPQVSEEFIKENKLIGGWKRGSLDKIAAEFNKSEYKIFTEDNKEVVRDVIVIYEDSSLLTRRKSPFQYSRSRYIRLSYKYFKPKKIKKVVVFKNRVSFIMADNSQIHSFFNFSEKTLNELNAYAHKVFNA